MRLPIVVGIGALGFLGVVAANATTGCSYTSQGQGGEAGAPWNDAGGGLDASFLNGLLGGGSGGSSGGSSGGNNGSGSGGSSGGSVGTSSSSGGSSGGTKPGGSSSGGSSGGSNSCAPPTTFPQDCQAYFQQYNAGGACGQCAQNSGCLSSEGSCNLQVCEQRCGTTAASCNCIGQCLQTASNTGGCCPITMDGVFQCATQACDSEKECSAPASSSSGG